MGSIKAVCSMLEYYYDACRNNYGEMLRVVEVLLKKTERYAQDVEQKHDHAKRKVGELNMAMPEVKVKADKYYDGMEMCKDRINEAQGEINYCYSHPIIQSTTDSEGNTTTTSTYDYAAIYAAERKKAEAERQYDQYNRLYSKASDVYQRMDALRGEIEGKREIIQKGLDRIKNCEAELKKYIQQISSEGNYNLKSLEGVMSELTYYVNCSPIEPYGSVAGGDFGTKVASQSYASSYSSAINSGTGQSGSETSVYDHILTEDDLYNEYETPSRLHRKKHRYDVCTEELYDKTSNEHYGKLTGKLLSCEFALNKYAGSAFDDINKYLRKNDKTYEEMCRNLTESITRGINDVYLPKDMMLYRGISTPRAILGENWENKDIEQLREKFVGGIFRDKGFCSTSTSKDIAHKFAEHYSGTILKINAPKGANGVFMVGVSGYKHEKEVLLQRSSCFKIISIEPNPTSNGYIIELDLVGKEVC